MPLRQDFGSFRRPVDVIDPLAQAFANVQKTVDGIQLERENKRRYEEDLLLKKAADQRAQDTFAMGQAEAAKRDFTSNMLGKILATPQAERANVLADIQKNQGGFTPNAQEYSILQKALEGPEVKPIPGTVTISKDGRSTTVPYQTLTDWEKRGWKVGKETGDGSGSSKKKSSGGFNFTLSKGISDRLTEQLGGQDDVDQALSIGRKLQVWTGLDDGKTEELLNQGVNKGNWFYELMTDQQVTPERVTQAVKNAGITPNITIPNADGSTRLISHEEFAKAFMNPNLEVRTMPNPNNPKKNISVLVDVNKFQQTNDVAQSVVGADGKPIGSSTTPTTPAVPNVPGKPTAATIAGAAQFGPLPDVLPANAKKVSTDGGFMPYPEEPGLIDVSGMFPAGIATKQGIKTGGQLLADTIKGLTKAKPAVTESFMKEVAKRLPHTKEGLKRRAAELRTKLGKGNDPKLEYELKETFKKLKNKTTKKEQDDWYRSLIGGK